MTNPSGVRRRLHVAQEGRAQHAMRHLAGGVEVHGDEVERLGAAAREDEGVLMHDAHVGSKRQAELVARQENHRWVALDADDGQRAEALGEQLRHRATAEAENQRICWRFVGQHRVPDIGQVTRIHMNRLNHTIYT